MNILMKGFLKSIKSDLKKYETIKERDADDCTYCSDEQDEALETLLASISVFIGVMEDIEQEKE